MSNEVKKEEPKREETKKEEPKKEEKISLTLSKTLLHRNENNTSKATATTPGGKTASANLTLEKDLTLTITAGSENKTISYDSPNKEFATTEASQNLDFKVVKLAN